MPFRERTSTLLHGRTHGRRADTADDLTPISDGDAPNLVELAEAEAAEAEAVAAAAKARARALRLRQQAEAAARAGTPVATTAPDVPATETVTPGDESDAAEDATGAGRADEAVTDEQGRSPRRIRRPSWLSVKRFAVSAALLVLLAALTASGYMVWHHRQAESQAQRSAEFSAAARQGVVSLMSLDFNKAEEDVQRIIDNSTGQFREDFQAQAEDFASVAQESKVITEATVNSTAVQSMTDDSAIVLVAATSRITNTTGARQEPRTWRLSVELEREGDRIKMSRVEFVP